MSAPDGSKVVGPHYRDKGVLVYEALAPGLVGSFVYRSPVRTAVSNDQGAGGAVLPGFEVDPAGSDPLE